MRTHLNTLFINTQGSYLAKKGECIDVRQEQRSMAMVPIHTLEGVACFGQVSYSPYLMAHCAEHGVSLSHFDERGRFLAAMRGPTSGNVLLRRQQYRWADDPQQAAQMTRFILHAKLRNGRTVMARALRERGQTNTALETTVHELGVLVALLDKTDSVESLRGLEGRAGALYWGSFQHLIYQDSPEFKFFGRSRRPPLDRVNALLSFLYAMLMHDVRSALEGVGLDPYVGFLHQDRPGRPGLALDMMEEFRPYLADRLALTLINRGQLGAKDFEVQASQATYLTEAGRKKVIVAYQKRKDEQITHPFLQEHCAIGMVWHLQALLLARYIRGDLDGYPAFLWR
ncbi:CRISPR-associated protein, Cas1 family [Magnetococcus marinus MC-1]|uniref:CRISPR-associated endonuclease Cas1 n=1 Tax=Magnetococcus marinus (strain ATCC BAA-1437 / JCM 17883 / MC-1) TaxID=156889 RepID=A0LDG6_MAGMM|nr:type I-C CRISPR-associated endonuclease Cas1c [Magnetococcus marinus]ABK46009.1 CRISPR-associated protein, Cas1 family [Magnetococcus marinus MC-1]